MMYKLKGDREVENEFVRMHLPEGNGLLLDIGPAGGNRAPTVMAIERGWHVTGVCLKGSRRELSPQWAFIRGDFNEVEVNGPFDWILNVSTIEHFGLAGRYGITIQDDDADLRGMQKALGLLRQDGKMLLTIPVGKDAVFMPRHRVYGIKRLPQLLTGYEKIKETYHAKFDGIDIYKRCSKKEALLALPTLNPSYYALGCFILAREEQWKTPQ